MSALQWLGVVLCSSPSVLMFAAHAVELGWRTALAVWVIVLATVGMLLLGVALIAGGLS